MDIHYGDIYHEIIKDRKIIIYGYNRFQKDFIYIFDQLKIDYIIEDNISKSDSKITCFNELSKEDLDSVIVIICKYDKKIADKNLQDLGLRYKDNFYYADDFFQFLDFDLKRRAKNRKVAVWGVGCGYSDLKDHLNRKNMDLKYDFIIDNNSHYENKIVDNKKVIHSDNIKDWTDIFIIIATRRQNYKDISRQLEEYGLIKNHDFVIWEKIIETPSEFLIKTIYDQPKYKFVCRIPFDYAILNSNGDVNNCCLDYMNVSIGNLDIDNFEDIWKKSIYAKILRLSMVNHTYSFCNQSTCPYLAARKTDQISENDSIEENYRQFNKNSKITVNIAMDDTCNLYCESCRPAVRSARGERISELNYYSDMIQQYVLPLCNRVLLAGNGEVFASKFYLDILKNEKCKAVNNIVILSNGTLFNRNMWNEYLSEYKNIDVLISIDAFSRENYEAIRRGASFEKTSKNLQFLGELRKLCKINYLQFNYVIQKKNCSEMKEFVRFSKKIGADKVAFLNMENWGIYSNEIFSEMSVLNDDGKIKNELLKYFDDELLNDRYINWYTMQKYLKNIPIDYYEERNYYGVF